MPATWPRRVWKKCQVIIVDVNKLSLKLSIRWRTGKPHLMTRFWRRVVTTSAWPCISAVPGGCRCQHRNWRYSQGMDMVWPLLFSLKDQRGCANRALRLPQYNCATIFAHLCILHCPWRKYIVKGTKTHSFFHFLGIIIAEESNMGGLVESNTWNKNTWYVIGNSWFLSFFLLVTHKGRGGGISCVGDQAGGGDTRTHGARVAVSQEATAAASSAPALLPLV